MLKRSTRKVPPLLRRDTQREAGAASVEFGLIAVLLVFLFAGLVDLALTLQMKRNLSDSVRAAARSGAQACIGSATCTAGNPQDADITAVEAVRSVLGSSAAEVSKIIIYQSATADLGVPALCLTTAAGGVNNTCNILRNPFAGATYSVPTFWPIATRVRNAANAEYMGIYVEYAYENPVSIYGSNRNLKSQSAFRLEPPATETAALVVLPDYPNVNDPVVWTYNPNWSPPAGYVPPANGDGGG